MNKIVLQDDGKRRIIIMEKADLPEDVSTLAPDWAVDEDYHFEKMERKAAFVNAKGEEFDDNPFQKNRVALIWERCEYFCKR